MKHETLPCNVRDRLHPGGRHRIIRVVTCLSALLLASATVSAATDSQPAPSYVTHEEFEETLDILQRIDDVEDRVRATDGRIDTVEEEFEEALDISQRIREVEVSVQAVDGRIDAVGEVQSIEHRNQWRVLLAIAGVGGVLGLLYRKAIKDLRAARKKVDAAVNGAYASAAFAQGVGETPITTQRHCGALRRIDVDQCKDRPPGMLTQIVPPLAKLLPPGIPTRTFWCNIRITSVNPFPVVPYESRQRPFKPRVAGSSPAALTTTQDAESPLFTGLFCVSSCS